MKPFSPLIFIFILLSLSSFNQTPVDHPAPFVWLDETGEGRFQVAFFRYELTLDAEPSTAEIHLFADSRYHLSVNGRFINFGPARFYPAHPTYDTYDLRPYLNIGANVIAVKVFSNGTSSFQLRRNPAGFTAWGSVQQADGLQWSLATPGDWKARRATGYDPDMPRMTFALGPMERYDARPDPPDWDQPAFRLNDEWKTPVVLGRQDTWGTLTPRSIPHLTQDVYRPESLEGVYALVGEEDLYSFRLSVPDKSWDAFRQGSTLFGHTYIYSPEAQDVTVGVWRGEHFLNGEGPLEKQATGPDKPQREDMVLQLDEGWNAFFVRGRSSGGRWDFFLAAPRDAGLVLSTTRQSDSEFIFMTVGPFMDTESERIDNLPVPFVPADLPTDLSAGWKGQARTTDARNPAVNVGWSRFAEKKPVPAYHLSPITVEDEAGTALVYDFRYKRLGRIVVEYEAPSGTVLDIGFSEDMLDGKARTLKRGGLYPSTRHIAREGFNRLETLKPYGLRYLQINVRENTGPVTIKDVYVVQQVYPFELQGSFESSDPMMDAIWEVGWRTLVVCAEDSYTDTPFRERGLYAGDMLPQMGVTLTGSSDLRLIRRSLELFQDMYVDQFNPGTPRHPDEIDLLEDYPLLTLEALMWYYDRTGDLDFVAELYPAYARMIRHIMGRRNERGLVHSERVFIEWTQIEKRDVENTAYHAILARSARSMARLASALNRSSDAGEFDAYVKEIQEAVQIFWNESEGAFHDGWKDGELIDHYYPISSAWPVLAGLTTPEQTERITFYIVDQLKEIGEINRQRRTTPYGSFYLLGELYEQEQAGAAETFMRKYWSPMVLRHNDTAWENFGDEGIGTLSHAWSAAPTYYLTTRVLGVDLGWPVASNPDSLVIAPQAESIDRARGTVPHPRGVIKVEWEVRGDQLWINCEIPEGVTWSVRPRGRLADLELWVNGRQWD